MPGVYNRQSSGGSISIKDEGITLTGAATSIDFTGAGVTASVIGAAVTATIPGGAGGSVSLLSEAPASGSADDSNTAFSFTHAIAFVTLNGQIQNPNTDITVSPSTVVTFNTPPATGSEILNWYIV